MKSNVKNYGFYLLMFFYMGCAGYIEFGVLVNGLFEKELLQKKIFGILLMSTLYSVVNGFFVYPFCASICGRTDRFIIYFKSKKDLHWLWKGATFASWIIALYELLLLVIGFGLVLTAIFE